MAWQNNHTGISAVSSVIRIVAFSLLLFLSQGMKAQDEEVRIIAGGDTLKPSKYIAPLVEQPQLMFFQGFTLSADLFGPVQYLISDYGSFEAALRLNLLNTYLPIVEAGYGKCDCTDDNTDIHYKASAPYLRVGCDINLLKNKFQENRLFAGLRYGITSFKYDMDGPSIVDPIWGGSSAFDNKGVKSTCHWAELVVGVQVKVWKNLHMGWTARYKKELSIGTTDFGKPYYVPGYGTTTNTSCWGGTYNLIFDLNWGKKKYGITNAKTQ